ncbi:stage II sporulation protein M [Halorarum halophilum]|uniref:Stage II sporulation protein M n=1 Tax=Halorarum halophilum TaxID=2743090 RepID=A0A7D5GCJ0_9EURY|nr:stage II sporulation protein M [Halobaculum halophilum]QLG28252.1 stage II sporulation protein M [Halobaculum halophilum]
MSTDRSPSLSDALTAAGRVLVDHPVAVVSAYLLATAVVPVARVPFLAAFAAAVGLLASMGRIEPLVQALADQEAVLTEGGGQGEGSIPGGFGEGFGGGGGSDPALSPELQSAVDGLLIPEVGALLVAGLVVTAVVALLAQSVASAVTYGTLWAAIDERPPLVDGVATAGRWRSYLGLVLVRIAVVGLAVAVPLAVGVLLGGAAGLAVGGLLALAGLLVVLATLLLLAFSGPAVVVDGVGAMGAIRGSVGFVRRNPGVTVAFVLVAAGAYVGASILVGLLNVAGAGRIGGVILALAVAPLLDAFATALYAGRGLPAAADRRTVGSRLRGGVRGGWRELWRFVRHHPIANVLGALLIVAGIAGGYAYTAPMGVSIPPPADVAGVFGVVPIGPFANIAANNWLVSAGTAFGGLAFGVPAAASLLFNGVLIGALAGLFDRLAFIALVAPHGVLELPAIAVAGGLGLHLGVVGWRAVRGQSDAAAVAAELRRATWVLVGLALVLVLASFVEAFLTPRIAAYVLG